MGKQEIKIKDFFEGKRRKCSLRDFNVQRGKNGKHTIKLAVVMPLSNTLLGGIPDVFAELYALMGKEKSPHNFCKVAVVVESAQFSIFTTDVSKRHYVSIGAASLQDFTLVGEGLEEKRNVNLEFNVYLPGTEQLRDWSWDHLHSDFFVEVVPSQLELTEAAEEPKPETGKKKNGKQLDLVQ